MHIVTLTITDKAYKNILYFLKNFSGDVQILSDKATKDTSIKTPTSLKGIFNQYADTSKMDLESTVSQQMVVEKYQKENF